MSQENDNKSKVLKLALISEYPPPAAGMTVLAQDFAERMQQEGAQVYRVITNPHIKGFNWLLKIPLLKTLYRFSLFLMQCLLLFRCNVIHVFSASGLNFFLFTLPPLFFATLYRKPILLHYHGGSAQEFFQSRRKLLAWSMKHCRRFVVPSRYLAKVFAEFGFTVDIIANHANVERFHFKAREFSKPVVLSVRNLTAVYNVQCAVKAFAKLQAKYPDAEFYILGDGPERANIASLVARLALRNVFLTGNIDNDRVPDYFARANILINASNVDNMPGSIIEAFASGLPVVTTSAGGIPYMQDQKATCLLSSINEDQQLGDNLIRVMQDSVLRQSIVSNAHEYLQSLHWNAIKQQWLMLYNQLKDN